MVQVDGLPRPATVVSRAGGQVLVRFRQAGGFEERWMSAADVLPVEQGTPLPPWWKLAGLALVAVLGLALLLWPGGSNSPLLVDTPSPTPSISINPSPSPSARP